MKKSLIHEIFELYDLNRTPSGTKTGEQLFFRGLGLDPDDNDALSRHLQEIRQLHWTTIIDPVFVAREEDYLSIPLRLPYESKTDQLQLHWTITLENNSEHSDVACSRDLSVLQLKEINGQWYIHVVLEISIPIPNGYHTLSVTFTDNSGQDTKVSCQLIITPQLCYLPPGLLQQSDRVWGISCNLDTVRSRGGWGIGNFSDLETILIWGAENGAAALVVTPLQPMLSYQPPFAWKRQLENLGFLSHLYLDLESLEDFYECQAARDFVHDPVFQAHLARLREEDYTNYDEVAAVKITVLQMLWQHFRQNHLDPETERGQQFREFQHSGGDALRFWSIFASLQSHFKEQLKKGEEDCQNWPIQFQYPTSPEVAGFAQNHGDEVGLQQYIQWQADRQLEATGRRSMELGLKVGLLLTLPHSKGRTAFDEWRGKNLSVSDGESCINGGDSPPASRSSKETAPPFPPLILKQKVYDTLINTLRTLMRFAGGLRLDWRALIEHQHLLPVEISGHEEFSLHYPILEILSVVALESQRNKCMVICDHTDNLSEKLQSTLVEKQIFLSWLGRFAVDKHTNWLSPERYPKSAVIGAGSDMTSLHDFWSGKDIVRQTRHDPDSHETDREEMIITRAADRARLLVALQHEGLLPHEYDVDPATVPCMTPALTKAVHLFLVKSAARFFLLQLENLPVLQDETPAVQTETQADLLQRKLPLDLETIITDNAILQLLEAFSNERGIGVVKPSTVLTERQKSRTAKIPRAFYRLQLNRNFSFSEATNIVPYLEKLGISHCYTSPYLQSRPGSSHGYDIIDHSSINTEIGSREEYEKFVAELVHHDMSQIFDMVPNHMGVGSDNKWWMDVLENGKASLYADFFDINWQPQQHNTKGRVLLPVLGSYYGSALEDGHLHLEFAGDRGAFYFAYFEHRFPVAPPTYPFILSHDLQRLEDKIGLQHDGFLELQSLITSLTNLPEHHDAELEQMRRQQQNREVLKRQLAGLCSKFPEILVFIEENVVFFNGKKGKPESFDLLHALHERQAYRLAFWRVASDEINYRRFFDINELACIRIEEQRVFDETHSLVLDLIATGKIDALRIDHPDGLYNPGEYFHRLQSAVGAPVLTANQGSVEEKTGHKKTLPLYVVVEKILNVFEYLRDDWLIHGSTGYDFAATLNGLFVDAAREKQMTALYRKFIGEKIDPDFEIYRCKKLIIKTAMAGELNVLAGELHQLAQKNRYTQDFTLNGLRSALIEIIAFFPVYRTYINSDNIAANERNYIEWAVAKAKEKHAVGDTLIYDFIKATLLLEQTGNKDRPYLQEAVDFVMKLQQYTGPIMAKGLEDTFFYIYNRLLSLNEVGGDPRRYGISPAAFHHANNERRKHWPHAMLNTSTHDSKRSEDVRARINVLSEIPGEWQEVLRKWTRINRRHKTRVDVDLAPSKNDEYAFYQNLLGIWPLEETGQWDRKEFSDRIAATMLKGAREAKIHTSWINQDLAYEAAIETFVRGVLNEDDNSFLSEFIPFQKKVAWFGMLNSLAQLLLKLTSPGVPDIYQGNEIWNFRLVDPDNRQPVDFEHRRILLEEQHNFMCEQDGAYTGCIHELLKSIFTGGVKLYTTWQTMSYRRQHSDLFENGSYLPLQVEGSHKEHICAFMRRREGMTIITAVPRLVAGLLYKQTGKLPLGREIWHDTQLIIPAGCGRNFKNIFTGEKITARGGAEKKVPASAIFSSFPITLLENE